MKWYLFSPYTVIDLLSINSQMDRAKKKKKRTKIKFQVPLPIFWCFLWTCSVDTKQHEVVSVASVKSDCNESQLIRRSAALCLTMLHQLLFIANWTRWNSGFYFKPLEWAVSGDLTFLLKISWLLRSITARF